MWSQPTLGGRVPGSHDLVPARMAAQARSMDHAVVDPEEEWAMSRADEGEAEQIIPLLHRAPAVRARRSGHEQRHPMRSHLADVNAVA
jgi:hypothetical protein